MWSTAKKGEAEHAPLENSKVENRQAG